MHFSKTDTYCSISNLRYKRNKTEILKINNLEIPLDKITYILGNNGSGKSTLIDIITDNLKGYSGSIRLKNITKGNTGVIFDTIPFSPSLMVKELIKLFQLIYGVGEKSLSTYMNKLKLETLLKKQFKVLSLGEKKRLGILFATFHNPKLLILDEPFGGIDTNSVNTINSMLYQEQRTCIISSHNWNVAKESADFIFFLYNGKQLLDSLVSPNELLSDNFIPYSRKIMIDIQRKESLGNLSSHAELVLTYDNNLHFFTDTNSLQDELNKRNIPYSIEEKSLNDIYNYLVIRE